MRETETLLKAVQNNVIRTIHIKARIDKTQQNIKCRLYSDSNGTINQLMIECSKLLHDWVGKEIHWAIDEQEI